MPTPIAASWQSANGDWFVAGNWVEPNPNPPPATLDYVPGANNSVNISDGTTAITVTYNGTDEVYSLGGSNATLAINGGALTVDNNSFFGGGINLAAGAALYVASGATLTYLAGTVNGTLGGAGTIQFQFGAFSLGAGTVLSVANFILGVYGNGTVSTTTLTTDLSYSGNFTEVDYSGNNAVLQLNGHTLTLNGTDTLDGTIVGPGSVVVTGTATEPTGYGGDNVVGGAVLEAKNGATITQKGSVYLGDTTTTGTLKIDAGATYDIVDSTSLGGTTIPNSIVNNAGLFDVSGASTVQASTTFTNTGTLTVETGSNINIYGGVESLGGVINGGGTLSLGFADQATITTTNVTIGGIYINGGNGGGTTTLAVDLTYAGNFNFNNQFGTLALNGHTLTVSGTSNFYGALNGGGLLKVTGSATLGYLNIGYNGAAAATIEDAGSINEINPIALNGLLQIDSGATYTITNAPYGGAISTTGASGATTVNNGTLSDATAGGSAEIDGVFTNNNALSIAATDTLYFSGTETFGGAISGAGTLSIGFAAQATITTTNVTVANIYINGGNGGGTTTLDVDLTYAGNFNFNNQFGTLALNGHTLTVSGTSSFSGANVSGGGVLKVTGTATLGYLAVGYNGAAAATIEDAGAITQNNPLTLNGTLQIDNGATYTITNAPYGGGITSTGTSGATTINNGAFVNQAAGYTFIQGAFTNNGSISSTVGQLIFSGAVTGSGSASLSGGAWLAFHNAFNQNVAFQGAGTLSLSQTYGGVISGFATGDMVDLANVTYAAGEHMVFQSIANGVQTYALENASNSVLATLNFRGHYSAGLFQVQQDSSTGALVSLTAPPTTAAAANDYDPDGVSDLLWQSQSTGGVYEWQMSGGQHVANTYLGNLSGWSDIGVGDFYGAGAAADILWQSQSTGGVYEWQMSGGQHVSNVYLGDLSGWNEIGVGDFYGNGTSDILWQSQSTGDVYEWTMSNGQHTGNVYLGNLSGWNEIGAGDFQGNGTSDILWQNQSTGDVYEWTMSSGQHSGSDIYLGNLSGWSEVGIGDFYGNGTSDILWENQTTGVVYEWQMSGGQHTGSTYLGNLPGWSVVGTGDYTGNGVSDVVWQNASSGATYEWIMSNGQPSSSVYLGNLGGWQGK
jgi:hypothetical protein